jgi:hypothetical protein
MTPPSRPVRVGARAAFAVRHAATIHIAVIDHWLRRLMKQALAVRSLLSGDRAGDRVAHEEHAGSVSLFCGPRGGYPVRLCRRKSGLPRAPRPLI